MDVKIQLKFKTKTLFVIGINLFDNVNCPLRDIRHLTWCISNTKQMGLDYFNRSIL